jgi:hypothetical protein
VFSPLCQENARGVPLRGAIPRSRSSAPLEARKRPHALPAALLRAALSFKRRHALSALVLEELRFFWKGARRRTRLCPGLEARKRASRQRVVRALLAQPFSLAPDRGIVPRGVGADLLRATEHSTLRTARFRHLVVELVAGVEPTGCVRCGLDAVAILPAHPRDAFDLSHPCI